MRKMLLLFSHRLSEEQIKDAKEKFDVDEFISLPNDLQNIWSNISPDINSLKEVLIPIKEFIKTESELNDIVLIQGDFGAVYSMVNFCQDLRLIPIYATTKRVVEEYLVDNKLIKESVFEHRRFRKYE